ncbi:MAG: Cys-tRNA(Pro) deacylase [Spirochaetes bacterium]|nr:Cys-tRNA(Pro) deacylase [Spirochaetota bacterium]
MKQVKTNAIRLLESKGIAHSILYYDPSDGRIDARAVAEKLGKLPEQLYKTLVCRSETGVLVFCIPGSAELDLKKAAKAAGVKRVELIGVRELQPLTGYVRGGCSPIGMRKAYPTFLDKSCLSHKTIIISGGALGVQVEISPEDLWMLTEARISDLIG